MTYHHVPVKDVYETDNIPATIRKVDENLRAVGLACSIPRDSLHAERIQLLEFAVTIEDAEVRKAFAKLICRWVVVMERSGCCETAIGQVRQQLDTLLTKLEDANAKK